MPPLDPFAEKRGMRILDVARPEMQHSLGTRHALEIGPYLGEFRGHIVRGVRASSLPWADEGQAGSLHYTCRRRVNVATSGLHSMRTGGMAPIPRLTYINTSPTR